MKLKESRRLSFIVILTVYALAFGVGLLVYHCLASTGWHYLWQLFIADAAAFKFDVYHGVIVYAQKIEFLAELGNRERIIEIKV